MKRCLLSYAVNSDLSRASTTPEQGRAAVLRCRGRGVASAGLARPARGARGAGLAHRVPAAHVTYRVTFAGRSQNYNTREEAFAAISRSARWKIAEPGQVEDGSHHYVEFSYRLDTSLLPRPMQIGIGGQADWALSVQRMQRIN